MALNVISNFAANVAHRNLVKTDMQLSTSLAKLSSGQRIVSAKDDAASMAIGSRLAAEVGALSQASANAGQAASMLQIADGSMARATEILIRMKTLAVQSASGQLGNTERTILNLEYQALKEEIARIGADTEFNGVKMLAGSQSLTFEGGAAGSMLGSTGFDSIIANGITFAGTDTSATLDMNGASNANGNYTLSATDGGGSQYSIVIGSASFTGGFLTTPTSVTLTSTNAQVTGTININLNTAFANNASLGDTANNNTVQGTTTTSFTFKIGSGAVAAEDDLTFSIESLVSISGTLAADITTVGGAETSSSEVTAAIDALSSARANVGAGQSRLDFAAANLATAVENTEAARSALLDLDIASEMTEFTSKQTLLQAGVSMLAQANQVPQALLRLFQ
ncbi:MAG TPA: flagellin [Alphaproteobacteria bacterium]|nr:flagellin [Alphaproteobacteria bacterium]